MLLERSRVIDEIRFPEPHGQNPPTHNRSSQAPRYCFDFRKFRHEGIANKIAHPPALTQADDTNPTMFTITRNSRKSLLLIVRIGRMPGNHNRMRLQRLERHLNGALELRIVAGCNGGRI